jgi:hypothetical protein
VSAFSRTCMIAILLALVSLAQESPRSYEREFPFPLSTVEAALYRLGAYTGARLPALEGFIRTNRSGLPSYQRAYYEYKIDLVPANDDQTLVRLKANISAWYEDPQGKQSGYQACESNGRLESDLLDRLNDLLNSKDKVEADPQRLATKLQEIRQRRAQTEARISELQHEIENLETAASAQKTTDSVSVLKSPTSIFARPAPGIPRALTGAVGRRISVPGVACCVAEGGARRFTQRLDRTHAGASKFVVERRSRNCRAIGIISSWVYRDPRDIFSFFG